MSTVKPAYEDLENQVRELEGLLDAMRSGDVDFIVSDRDPSHLLVLREYELELQKERQLAELRAIIEAVPTALAIVWPDGEIRLANHAFCDVSCPGHGTTLHQWAAGLQAHAEFGEELEQHLAKSREGSRQPVSVEATFRTRAGNQLHWLIGVFT